MVFIKRPETSLRRFRTNEGSVARAAASDEGVVEGAGPGARRRYRCPSCGLGFAHGGNFARHVRALHVQRRPHACHVCSKTFSRKSHLEDHVKSHSERREYVCDVCGKASKYGAALRMHRKTHDVCKHKCLECSATFKRKVELQAHVSVHTGERAHVCRCGRAFRLRGQLNGHRKRCAAPDA